MFETSQDLLNWALGVGAFLALFGLALVFFYTAKILRQVYKMMTTIEGAFDAARALVEKFKERISGGSAVGKLLVDAADLIGDFKQLKKDATKTAKKAQKSVQKKIKK